MNRVAYSANAFDVIRMLESPRFVSRAGPAEAATIAGDALDFAGILVSGGPAGARSTSKPACR